MKPFTRHALLLLVLLGILLPVLAQDQLPAGETTPPAASSGETVPPKPPVAASPGETVPQTPATPANGQAPPTSIYPSTPESPQPPIPPPNTPPVIVPPVPPATLPLPTPAAPTPKLGVIPLTVRSNRSVLQPSLGLYMFLGDVTMVTTEAEIHADEVTYNERTRSALARGNVSITTGGNTYWGNILQYEVTSHQWRFLDFRVEYPAGFLGPPFIAPVFINGREVGGLTTTRYTRANNAEVTTCDFTKPHYEITSRKVEIFPGDKLIARDNDFYVLGHRILHLPWFFLSLRQYQTPIVPVVGQNSFEGYYARFLYQYVLSPNQLGGIRLDTTTKRGIGLGVDHFYTMWQGTGEAFLYGREDLSEYVARLDHTQQLPGQIDAKIHTDIRQDSQFTNQPTTVTDVNTTLTRNTDHTASTFNLTRRLLEGTYSTDNLTSNLRYNSSVAAGKLSTSIEYSSFGRTTSSATTPADQELWNRLKWTHPMGFANFNLQVDQRNDLDGDSYTGDNNISGVQRLPELYLSSDQNAMHLNFLKQYPSTFTLGWGRFDEMSTKTTLDRYRFEWGSTGSIKRGSSTLNGALAFRQTVYGDQDLTALYMYNGSLNLTTRAGAWANVARYTRQESSGFTPFRFDTVYPSCNATDSLQYILPNVRMYLTSGRDIEHDRWQDLTFRGQADITKSFSTSQALGYDFNNGIWRDLVSNFYYERDPLVIFNLGSRYDMENKHFKTVSTQLQWVITPKWRVQWLGGYDAINKEFLYNEYLITRDLHCWDASFYYSADKQESYFYLRLKALNTPLPSFGIGRGGNVINTDQGIGQ